LNFDALVIQQTMPQPKAGSSFSLYDLWTAQTWCNSVSKAALNTFKDMTQSIQKQEAHLQRSIQKMKMQLTFITILLKFRTIFMFHIDLFGPSAGLPSSKPNPSHQSQEKKIVAMIMSEPLPRANKVDHGKHKWGRKRKEKWLW